MLSNKEKNFISAIVYIHNGQEDVYEFLTAVNHQLFQYFERYEIICVNDASSDKSIQEIQRFSSEEVHCEVSILNMGYYQGVDLSMVAGIDLSIGDFVFEFDSIYMDYQPELLIDVYQHSLIGFDLVSASPNQNIPNSSKLFYTVFNKFSNSQYPLRAEAFRILSRRAVNRVHGISVNIPYRKAIYANCGLKMDTVLYRPIRATFKTERMEHNKNMDTAIDAIILHTNLAYQCSITLSMIMIITAFLMGIYTLVIYIGGYPVAGWTTTMLFLACAFGGLFIIQTIIIKYISLILKTVFNKKRYIIESVIKLENQS